MSDQTCADDPPFDSLRTALLPALDAVRFHEEKHHHGRRCDEVRFAAVALLAVRLGLSPTDPTFSPSIKGIMRICKKFRL